MGAVDVDTNVSSQGATRGGGAAVLRSFSGTKNPSSSIDTLSNPLSSLLSESDDTGSKAASAAAEAAVGANARFKAPCSKGRSSPRDPLESPFPGFLGS